MVRLALFPGATGTYLFRKVFEACISFIPSIGAFKLDKVLFRGPPTQHAHRFHCRRKNAAHLLNALGDIDSGPSPLKSNLPCYVSEIIVEKCPDLRCFVGRDENVLSQVTSVSVQEPALDPTEVRVARILGKVVQMLKDKLLIKGQAVRRALTHGKGSLTCKWVQFCIVITSA